MDSVNGPAFSYQPFMALPASVPNQSLNERMRAIPANVSAYFRRPARVAKTNKQGNSPKNLVRRRTTATANGLLRNRSITDGKAKNASFYSLQDGLSMESRPRPLSWHPSSAEPMFMPVQPDAVQQPFQYLTSGFLGPACMTPEINGLITPHTNPCADEPIIHEVFTPLDEMTAHDFDTRYAYLEEFSAEKSPFWRPDSEMQLAPPTYSQTFYPEGSSESQNQYGYLIPQFTTNATTSPQLSPHQQHPDPVGTTSLPNAAGEDELVGMGLYDTPSPTQSTSLACGSFSSLNRAGRGLKLEESWQPSAFDDDDDDDDDDDEAEGEEENEVDARDLHVEELHGEPVQVSTEMWPSLASRNYSDGQKFGGQDSGPAFSITFVGESGLNSNQTSSYGWF